MSEQLIIDPEARECPSPRPWDTYLVTEVDGVTSRPAASLAALGIRYAKDLAREVKEGTLELSDVKYVGAKTKERILADLDRLERTVRYTEELREKYQ